MIYELRLQYLSGIGIRKNKKVEFNLVEFVIQINKFLGISTEETRQELKDLKDNSDLINPITGQIANGSNENKEEKKDDGDKDKEKDVTDGNEEKKGDDDGEKKDEVGDEEKNEAKKEKKSKFNHKLKMKEKPLRQNILKIIDKDKFNIKEEKSGDNESKTTFSISLRDDEFEHKSIGKEDDENKDVKEDEDDIDSILKNIDDKDVIKELKKGGKGDDMIDAPHRDWSVLAKHLKDSSKEQARRKQILKQLERILHVREGLIVGFDQLKQIYNNYQQKKIGTK